MDGMSSETEETPTLPNTTSQNISKSGILVTGTPKFELDAYIGNYTGRTRFIRLFHIGTTSTVLAVDALKAAVQEAKEGNNVENYENAITALKAATKPEDPEITADQAWIGQKTKANAAETSRLEAQLKEYRNNLIKESIRMTNEELGQHYHAIGDLVSATKTFSKMREFCTVPYHVALAAFNAIHVAIDQGNWLAVQSATNKVQNLHLQKDELARALPKCHAALGLSHMHMQDYAAAANSFLATEPSLGESFNDVLSSNDVAVYGGLCALASMDRAALQDRVLDNSSFRSFLELESHLRRAITFFCTAKYAACLEILEAYRQDYLLDIHLCNHVDDIYSQIRTKAIVAYLVPFSHVTLASLEQTFSPSSRASATQTQTQTSKSKPRPTPSDSSSSTLLTELTALIASQILKARIDLENALLISTTATSNPRTTLHTDILSNTHAFRRDAHAKLLRMEFLSAGLEREVPKPGEGSNLSKGLAGQRGMGFGIGGGKDGPSDVGGWDEGLAGGIGSGGGEEW